MPERECVPAFAGPDVDDAGKRRRSRRDSVVADAVAISVPTMSTAERMVINPRAESELDLVALS